MTLKTAGVSTIPLAAVRGFREGDPPKGILPIIDLMKRSGPKQDSLPGLLGYSGGTLAPPTVDHQFFIRKMGPPLLDPYRLISSLSPSSMPTLRIGSRLKDPQSFDVATPCGLLVCNDSALNYPNSSFFPLKITPLPGS